MSKAGTTENRRNCQEFLRMQRKGGQEKKHKYVEQLSHHKN